MSLNVVEIPLELFERLLAAIETPGDLSESDVRELLEDAWGWYPTEFVIGEEVDDARARD